MALTINEMFERCEIVMVGPWECCSIHFQRQGSPSAYRWIARCKGNERYNLTTTTHAIQFLEDILEGRRYSDGKMRHIDWAAGDERLPDWLKGK